ncbi:MAG: hypothetical protein P4L56_05350 [Candidatus Sulfopaludibacter sp.]|nr:hypothetical protein [Candidatus Sulfopaludibacter sp.]
MRLLKIIALTALLPGACAAQTLTPAQALDRYLATSRSPHDRCAGLTFTIQIDASLPKLKKHGSMSGVKLLSQTGKIAYHGLQFTGDKLVKTDVIARFLAQDSGLEKQGSDASVSRQNYTFVYLKTSDYNGLPALVFHLKPRHKRTGLFEGELWLEAATATPLRLWGDFVKSPSIFVRNFRFVEDYQDLNQCFQPSRLLLTADTRIAGLMEMSVWEQFVKNQPASDLDQ